MKNIFEWESAKLNVQTFNDFYYRLLELAVSVFEWKNLPEEIDERYLELTLLNNGCSIFFYDEIMEEYASLPTINNGEFDIYMIPNKRRAYAVNGYNKNLTSDDSVLIYNNFLRVPTTSTLMLYARKLYEIERSIDVNVKAQKTPIIIQCDEKQRLVLKNLMMKYDGNEPFIYGTKGLDIGGITSIKTDTPYNADKLQILKKQYWSEVLTFLGIENVQTEKKERLISQEVETSKGGIEIHRATRLNARKQACKKINKMFNLDIDVKFREAEKNGYLYNNNQING